MILMFCILPAPVGAASSRERLHGLVLPAFPLVSFPHGLSGNPQVYAWFEVVIPAWFKRESMILDLSFPIARNKKGIAKFPFLSYLWGGVFHGRGYSI
jgi:hypothetical protein